MSLFELKQLAVEVDGNLVLKGVDLTINRGETHVLFGPNGSGKTTLIMASLGFPKYKVVSGQILFKGQDVSGLTLDQRIRMGMGVAFQRPPVVPGVKLRELAGLIARQDGAKLEKAAEELHAVHLLDRSVNDGFSGGEAKRSELLQLLMAGPELAFIDEPESGVDIESIAIIGNAINRILGKTRVKAGRSASALIVTHTAHILDYVNAEVGHVMVDGRIVCSGNPRDILKEIRAHGFRRCEVCNGNE